MCAAAVHSFLKPCRILKLRTTLDPFQSIHDFAVMGQEQILSQSKQTVHDLPGRVVFGREESMPCCFTGVPDQTVQWIG